MNDYFLNSQPISQKFTRTIVYYFLFVQVHQVFGGKKRRAQKKTHLKMQNQTFYIFLLVFILGEATLFSESKSKPNVVILFADDLGYGDLQCLGNPATETPNLKRMMDGGMWMTHWYTNAEKQLRFHHFYCLTLKNSEFSQCIGPKLLLFLYTTLKKEITFAYLLVENACFSYFFSSLIYAAADSAKRKLIYFCVV